MLGLLLHLLYIRRNFYDIFKALIFINDVNDLHANVKSNRNIFSSLLLTSSLPGAGWCVLPLLHFHFANRLSSRIFSPLSFRSEICVFLFFDLSLTLNGQLTSHIRQKCDGI